MQFTLGWLKDHLETTASLEQIVEKLTALGLEVEHVADRATAFAPFRVAAVISAEKHPDADRLRVCVVDTGTEKLQVVCGAPNARAGMKAVFAPAGSLIPGTGQLLKKGVIRGQESNGMLVSEREMGLSDAHEGIIDAPADAAIGTAFATLYGLDDPVIEINLTPNRADCAGVRGIARDLAAAGLGTLKPLEQAAVPGTFATPGKVQLEFSADAAGACPLFLGRLIRGVRNGPSPEWLQRRLKAIGLRPISALVDITNYLCRDLCRPLHVFDADKLRGDLHVRLAKRGETLVALNGQTYALDDFMTVVCDDAGVQGLAGVVGGADTGCTPETVNVYIECAYFDPARTARSGRALQISSDARYRFERGVDPVFTVPAMEIATRLVLELCGGTAGTVLQAGAVPAWQRTIAYNPDAARKLAGIEVEEGAQRQILQTLGFEIAGSGKEWRVQPPSWRADIEGAADLVEEIIRVHGYDSIPAVSLPRPQAVTHRAETPGMARARRARATLAGRGLQECVTWSFMEGRRAAAFGANDHQTAAALRLLNPISAELDQMRPSILPNLIDAASRNSARGFPDAALFEIGPVFLSSRADGYQIAAAGIRSGAKGPRHWSGADASRAADGFDAKADALAALEACGVATAGVQITRDVPAWYHPGRSGALRMGAATVGYFGEIHPGWLEDTQIRGAVSGFEIFPDRIPPAKKKPGTARKLLALPPFQPVSRDFAFIVDQAVEADTLVKAVRGVDRALIQTASVFDCYSGAGVPAGKKSIGLNVMIQPVEKTLTDAELEALAEKIVAAVAAKTGGFLRA